MRHIQNLISKISDAYSTWQYSRAALRGVEEFFTQIPDDSLEELTPEEIKMIDDKWKDVCPKPSIGYHAFRVFKKYGHFDADYVPEPYFYPYIVRILNPTKDYISLVHKGLIDPLFSDMNRPETVVKSFGKSYLIDGYESIAPERVADYLLSQDCDLIIKPAKDSNSGRGISIIKRAAALKELNEMISSYPTDFVIQKLVRQSDFTAQFNKTSLNTFRVITLYINGYCSLCYMILKLGAPGRFVDNGANGGLWIGVKEDGTLNEWGVNFDGEVHDEHNGIRFTDKRVPNYSGIVSFAKRAHAHIPMCGLIAWDIALDIHNEPVLIEANMWWPAISWGEICSGPIFGERTDEVIDYLKNNKLTKLGFSHSI